MINLFDDLPARAHEEIVTELLLRQGVRIERIVSTGQSTPADKPYNQDHDEWVLLLTGSAGLWIDRIDEWTSHKTSPEGPRKKALDKSRKEIPMFLALRARAA